MVPQFFGRQIDVTTGGEVKVPVSFRLDDREYLIADILDAWQDYGFGKSPMRRQRWWQRHHRNYYRVKTTEGEIFEIYYDRGTKLEYAKRRKWFLYRQL
jgi:hypothetical protein